MSSQFYFQLCESFLFSLNQSSLRFDQFVDLFVETAFVDFLHCFSIFCLSLIFIFPSIFFNWSIGDLQCQFLLYSKVSQLFIHVIHSFLDSIPIQVITEYRIELPVLFSRFLLVIYSIYSSVYMSIPISQFIPPLPFLAW